MGQSFTNAPMPNRNPERRGRIFLLDKAIRARSAKSVGTTSNRVKARGPIKIGHKTQNHAPLKPLRLVEEELNLNRFKPVINKVISISKSITIMNTIKPVKAFPNSHCGIANTTPASGGYCHMESSIGKIPFTKPLAQKLYKSTSPFNHFPSG